MGLVCIYLLHTRFCLFYVLNLLKNNDNLIFIDLGVACCSVDMGVRRWLMVGCV